MRSHLDPGEVPPTAGLPLRVDDLWPGRFNLAAALAAQTGRADALVTCSGTAALVVALATLARLSGRRQVIVPAYTCPLVALAVRHCGLSLRLCDARPGHFDMDPRQLETLVDRHTLAVIPAHLGGRLSDIRALAAIAHAAGACLIEDAAQALGARHADGTPAGAAGDVGVYSLAAGKGLSIYEGGLLMAADQGLHDRLRTAAEQMLPRHALRESRRVLELLGYWGLYRPLGLRLAYGLPLRRALRRGDPVGAVGDRFPARIPLHRVGGWRRAVGARAAARLPAFLASARTRAEARIGRLRQLQGLHVLEDAGGVQGTWPCLILQLPDRCSRDRALQRMWTAGLGVSRMFIHALPDYPELSTIVPRSDVPVARAFAATTLTVSNSHWLDDRRFEMIVSMLGDALARAPGTGSG